MIIISHRGNISGRVPERENSKDFVDEAINLGYNVEVDLRYLDGLTFLGHDEPEHPISIGWLLERKDKLWVHIKDIFLTHYLINTGIKYFFHEKERHVFIANSNYIWTHDLSETFRNSIIPLLNKSDISLLSKYQNVKGICSDYPSLIGI